MSNELSRDTVVLGGPLHVIGDLTVEGSSSVGGTNLDATTTVPGIALIRTAKSGSHPVSLTTDDLGIASGVATLDGSSKLVQNVDAGKITSGALADARLSANVDKLGTATTATAQKTFGPVAGKGPIVLAPGAGAGAPSTGAHLAGELYLDSTGAGLFLCTVAGTSGTWKQVTLV